MFSKGGCPGGGREFLTGSGRTTLPIKVESHDRSGGLIERVEMEDLRLNPEFSDDFFSLL